MLQLASDVDLDPLLVCLRILIRRCVHGNIGKDEVAKLFPEEVLPELQRLLTLLLQKFQPAVDGGAGGGRRYGEKGGGALIGCHGASRRGGRLDRLDVGHGLHGLLIEAEEALEAGGWCIGPRRLAQFRRNQQSNQTTASWRCKFRGGRDLPSPED